MVKKFKDGNYKKSYFMEEMVMKGVGFAVLLIVSIGFFDNASAKSFTDNLNDTVTDNEIGLIWQKSEGGLQTWEAALSYCENLSLGGYVDWRLPDRRELFSLVDFTIFNPALSRSFFPNVVATNSSDNYWSSTTFAGFASDAWRVSFSEGFSANGVKTSTSNVRCVRSGL